MRIIKIFNSSVIRYTPRHYLRHFSSNNKDSNDESKENKPKDDEKQETAAQKLNKLLANMKTSENYMLTKSVQIPKAGGRKHIKELEKESKKIQMQKDDAENIVTAAKNVAELIGKDDKEKTVSELLAKLLNNVDTGKSETSDSSESKDLREIISGLKIDKSTRADYVRNVVSKRQHKKFMDDDDRRESKRSIGGGVQLFTDDTLGIFKNVDELKESPDCLQTWDKLEKHELKLSITHPPSNYYEKMILWTEQGKLWKFPINNEYGLDEEMKIDFTEHIFLERHLESWCPEKGPIRHFMELVCVGLSKNPYITAKEKMEHILWYKDYFEQKKDILKQTIIHQQEEDKSKKEKLIN